MLLWLKKLIKPKWYVSYDCEECCNHFCGQCGRGVQEGNYCYTYKGAMKDALEWVRQSVPEVEDGDSDYEFPVITEINGHTTVGARYKPNGEKGHCPIFASIDLRQHW